MISKIGVGLIILGAIILFVEAILVFDSIWMTFLLISVGCLVVGVALAASEDSKNAEEKKVSPKENNNGMSN
jgi:membrane-bound ClpP family serine protease